MIQKFLGFCEGSYSNKQKRIPPPCREQDTIYKWSKRLAKWLKSTWLSPSRSPPIAISWDHTSGPILLMEEILHQLIGGLSAYPIIYRFLYIPGGAGFLSSTVCSHIAHEKAFKIHRTLRRASGKLPSKQNRGKTQDLRTLGTNPPPPPPPPKKKQKTK